MNRIRFIFVALLLMLGVADTLAQTRPSANQPQATVPPAKIAVIDTSVFANEKTGITRYVNALKVINKEFEPQNAELKEMQVRINTLSDEMRKLMQASAADNKTIQAKQEEGERLQRQLKTKRDQASAAYEKRYEEVTGPVSADIGKALDEFARQRGFTITFDLNKLAPAILTIVPGLDVTQAFITEFNAKYPAP
jgi:Skp family chaperone for outer membrane proteins